MIQNPSKPITLALIQMSCDPDPKQNLKRAIQRITEAAKQGAQIICLQELFASRYFCQTNEDKYFALAEGIPNNITEQLSELAREKQIVIVASVFEKAVFPSLLRRGLRGGPGEEEKTNYYNSAIVFDADGSLLGKYRKIHVPDDAHNYYSEKYYFKDGDLGFPVFETQYAKIGVQICWDQWFPEGARAQALRGAQIIFYPTAIGWPVKGASEKTNQKEFEAWITVQQGHAISNTVFVAATNRVGVEDHLNFWGSSFVSDPFGEILDKAASDEEENLIVNCELNRIEEVRKDWPFLSARREIKLTR